MTRRSHDALERSKSASNRGTVYLGFPYPVAAVLGLLALWFLLGPELDVRPELVSTSYDASRLSTEPRRTMMSDPPLIRIGSFEQRCSDCHGIFDSDVVDPPVELQQHTHIELRHGMNDRCYNCHGRDDRNKLLLHGGIEIGYDQVEMLCAKCHGTTYRDWEAGMHGRTVGSWDKSSGNQRRLKCTECHDPHRPAYDPIVPMPGPNALRQGVQNPNGAHEHHGPQSPLTKWKNALDGDASKDDAAHGGHR